MRTIDLELPDEAATQAFGGRLAAALPTAAVVHLRGELGAGKTTLVRALLRALGHQGPVRSPTYTLIEPYQLADRVVHHLDLYRLADPEELEYLGLRDLGAEPALLLVEWPQRGEGALPPSDLLVHLVYAGSGRHLHLQATSALGERALASLAAV